MIERLRKEVLDGQDLQGEQSDRRMRDIWESHEWLLDKVTRPLLGDWLEKKLLVLVKPFPQFDTTCRSKMLSLLLLEQDNAIDIHGAKEQDSGKYEGSIWVGEDSTVFGMFPS